jgi:hypothetical protein
VMGYLIIFLRCLCVNSFFSKGCEEYSKRQPTSNNVTSASIILPVTCCGVGHENAFKNTQGYCLCVRVCVRVLLLKASSCRARQFMSGVPRAEISVQIRKTSNELVVQRGAQQRPQGRSKTACTSPPPPTSVLVDFKNACAPNSSATTQHNMRSPRRLIFCAIVRIFPGSVATSSPEKPHLTP